MSKCRFVSLILAFAAVAAFADSVPPTVPSASESGPYGLPGSTSAGFSGAPSASGVPQTDATFSGAFEWRYPISLPAGTHGVQPRLTLTYNSAAPNGYLGEGFLLEGLSVIERDPTRGLVEFRSSDSYAIDGQRLYYSNSLFHREREVFDRIQAFTDGSTTPTADPNVYNSYWVVTTKDGTKLTYGKTGASRVPAIDKVDSQNRPLIRAWALERVEDPLGNYYSISYTTNSGSFYPDTISYTKNSNSTLDPLKWKMVKFNYDSIRSDRAVVYSPTRIVITKRLTSIDVSYGVTASGGNGPQVSYALGYGYSGSGNSHITSIQQKDATGTVISTANLTWKTDTVSTSSVGFDVKIPTGDSYQHNLVRSFSSGYRGANIIPGDFNGDGKTDFVRQEYGSWADGSSTTFQIYLANNSTSQDGTFSPPLTPPGTAYQYNLAYSLSSGYRGANIIPGDFDGDGRTDFIRQEYGSWADGSSQAFQLYVANSGTSVNGTFTIRTPHLPEYQNNLAYSFSSGTQGANIIPGDFNGDGKMDFIRQERGSWADGSDQAFQVYLANDLTSATGKFTITTPPEDEYQHNLAYSFSSGTRGANIIPGDFNGDGKMDFIRQERGSWADDGVQDFQVYLSRGDGTFEIVTPGQNNTDYQKSLAYSFSTGTNGANIIPGDFNGDGKTDFIRQERGSATGNTKAFQVFLSKGDGYFFDPVWDNNAALQASLAYSFTTGTAGAILTVADYNGDGLSDFVRQERGSASNSSTAFHVFLSKGNGSFAKFTPTGANFSPINLTASLASPATGCVLIPGDFDGDGKSDFIRQEYGLWADDYVETFKVFFLQSEGSSYPTGDLLTKIDLPTGGSISASYLPVPKIPIVPGVSDPILSDSSAFPNVALPTTTTLVTTVTATDNLLGSAGTTTSYQYYDGRYLSGKSRTDLGFKKVTKTVGTTRTTTVFSQTYPTQGLVQSSLVGDTQSKNYVKTEFKYPSRSTSPGSYFVGPLSVTTKRYDGQNTSFFASKRSFTYDAYGNVTEVKDWGVANGTESSAESYVATNAVRQVFQYQWASSGYLCRLVQAQQWSFNAAGTEEDIASETRYSYDHSSFLGPITKGLQTGVETVLSYSPLTTALTQLEYDNWGNPTSRKDPSNIVAFTAEYDNNYHSLVTSVTDARGLTTTVGSWNALLEPTSITDAKGNVSQWDYDSFGRQTKAVAPLSRDSLPSPTVASTYNDVPTATVPQYVKSEWKTQGTDKLQSVTYFDGLGRPIQTKTQTTTTGGWIKVDRYYDASGRNYAISVPLSAASSTFSWNSTNFSSQNKTVFTFDPLGRVIKTTNPDGSASRVLYNQAFTTTIDEVGRLVQVEDRGNVVTEKHYAALFPGDQLQSFVPPNSAYSTTTTQSYRGENRIVDTNGNLIDVLFDLAGRKTQYTDPDMGTWTYQYNANGSLAQQTDAKGNVTAFDYDSAGRVTAKKHGSTVVASYTYGTSGAQKGLLDSVSLDGSQYLTYTYDQLGRATAVTKALGSYGSRTLNLAYNDDGRLFTKQFAGGETLTYGYTPEGELNSLIGDVTYLSAVALDTKGRVTSRSWGNSTTTGYTFDDVTFRPETVTTPGILDLTYDYYADGNIKTKTDGLNAAANETYTYDEQARLSTAAGPYGSRSYKYDPLNNLLGMNGTPVNSYTGTKPHAITGDGTYTYTYDTNGNMTSRQLAGAADRTYSYDSENRMVSATVGGTETDYAYDDTRQRTTMTVGNKTTVFWFDGYEETYVDGTLTDSVRSYFIDGKKFAQTSSVSGVSYVYGDLLGSTSKVKDSSGTVTARYYEPFGKLAATDDGKVRQLFTGQEWDASSDLYYYNARYYSASLGRFVQPDTLLDGLNRYSYVQNDPVNFSDPTGMYTFSPAPGVSINTTTGTVTTPGGSFGSPSGSRYSPYHGPGVESSRNGQPFVGFDNNGRALYSLGSKSGSHFDHNTVDGLAVWALDGQLNSDAGNTNNGPDSGSPPVGPQPSGPAATAKKIEIDLFGVKVGVNTDLKSGNFNASIVFPSVKTEDKATLFGNDDLSVGLKGNREAGILQARIGLTDGAIGFIAESTAASVGMSAFASILGVDVGGGGSVKSGSVGLGVEIGPSSTVFAGLGYGFDVNFSLGFK